MTSGGNLIEFIIWGAKIKSRIRRQSQGQLMLRELLRILDDFPPNLPVVIDYNQKYPERLTSYRGYYEDLAITYSDEPKTVRDLINMLKSAIGQYFTGYKGGDFEMSETTPIWVSEWGKCEQKMVVGVRRECENAVLVTKEWEP